MRGTSPGQPSAIPTAITFIVMGAVSYGGLWLLSRMEGFDSITAYSEYTMQMTAEPHWSIQLAGWVLILLVLYMTLVMMPRYMRM